MADKYNIKIEKKNAAVVVICPLSETAYLCLRRIMPEKKQFFRVYYVNRGWFFYSEPIGMGAWYE